MTLNNRAWLLATVGFWGLFFAGYYFVPRPHFGELLNALMFSVALGVAATYSIIVWDAFKHARKSRSDILILGIWLGAVAIAGRGIVSLWWRWNGMPDEFADGVLWLGVIALSTSALALHLLAPGAIQGRIPDENFTRLGAWVALGTIIASLAVWWTTF